MDQKSKILQEIVCQTTDFEIVCFCIMTELKLQTIKLALVFNLIYYKNETFGMVYLEAMASGCACVAGNCDFGPSELIRDGGNGFLVPVRDYEAAAGKVMVLNLLQL